MGGGEDDGPNLLYAFELCGSYALVNLPGYYTVNTVLQTNLSNVEIRLTGAISYVPDIEYWSPASIYMTYVRRLLAHTSKTALTLQQNATTYWFFSGEGITLHGGGTIDANGQSEPSLRWSHTTGLRVQPGGTITSKTMMPGTGSRAARPVSLLAPFPSLWETLPTSRLPTSA